MTLLRNLLALIAAVLIVWFAVVNRQLVTLSFWPLTGIGETGTFQLPLFAMLLIGVFLGAIIGGTAVWASNHPRRVEYRQLRRQSQAQDIRHRVEEQRQEEEALERSRQRQEALALAAPQRR